MDKLIEMLWKYARDNDYRIQIYRKDEHNKSDCVYLIRGQNAIAITLSTMGGLIETPPK